MAKKNSSITEKARAALTASAQHAVAEVKESARPISRDATVGEFVELPIDAIAPNPRNVRTERGDLTDLADSIRLAGVFEPLVVRPLCNEDKAEGTFDASVRYLIVMGERRWAASHEAGLRTLPTVVRSDITRDSERVLMLMENMQREDLTPMDEARAFQQLMTETGWSQRQLAKELGKTQAHISRRVALLDLDDEVQRMVEGAKLGVDVAINGIGRLPLDRQPEVLQRLRELESSADGKVWEPETVRRVSDEVGRKVDGENRVLANRAAAEDRGARVVTDGKGVPLLQQAELVNDDEIDAAADAGDLLAAVGPRGVTYYSAKGKADAPQDDDTESAEAKERREWKTLQKGIQAWQESNRKPAKPVLTAALARHVAETAPFEEGNKVFKWLEGKSAAGDFDDYYAWKDSLTEEDYPQVAWLITVASDLSRSRYASSSTARERTESRIREVTS